MTKRAFIAILAGLFVPWRKKPEFQTRVSISFEQQNAMAEMALNRIRALREMIERDLLGSAKPMFHGGFEIINGTNHDVYISFADPVGEVGSPFLPCVGAMPSDLPKDDTQYWLSESC